MSDLFGTFDRGGDGQTIAIPPCGTCHDLSTQTPKALATGSCCRCGGYVIDGLKAARYLKALRLVASLEGR